MEHKKILRKEGYGHLARRVIYPDHMSVRTIVQDKNVLDEYVRNLDEKYPGMFKTSIEVGGDIILKINFINNFVIV